MPLATLKTLKEYEGLLALKRSKELGASVRSILHPQCCNPAETLKLAKRDIAKSWRWP